MKRAFIVHAFILIAALCAFGQGTSPNLNVPHVSTSQAQKEVTINQAEDQLDNAIAGSTSISVAGGSNVTLTNTQSQFEQIVLTGALTANISVIVPSKSKTWIFFNNTTGNYTLTVKTASGQGVIVPQTVRAFLQCDGVNVYQIISSATANLFYALQSDGGAKTVDFGPYWTQPASYNLPTSFLWEFWLMPTGNSSYMISDGYGAYHAVLFGMGGGVAGDGRYRPLAQLYQGGSSWVYTNTDTGPAPNEWCHMAYGWDGVQLLVYYDGVPIGKAAYTGARHTGGAGTGSGNIYIGGSDHSNFQGRIAQVRGFEGFNPAYFNNGQYTLPASFAPEQFFSRSVYYASGPYTPNFLASFLRPVQQVPDMAGGMVGIPKGLANGVGSAATFPEPQYVADLTMPMSQTLLPWTQPTGIVDTPPSTPSGALVFDSFSRANSTLAFGGPGGLGSTETGSNGVKTWTSDSPVSGSYGYPAFGILNGFAVPLNNAPGLAWVTTTYNGIYSVLSNRMNGTYGSGVDTGVVFRVQDKNNFWFAFTHNGGTQLDVGYYSAGVKTVVYSNLAMPTTWATLKVNTRNTDGGITIYGDTTQVIAFLNTTLMANQAGGLYIDSQGRGLDLRWDNFTILNS